MSFQRLVNMNIIHNIFSIFIWSLQNLVCILYLQPLSGPAAVQVLNNHMWLVATVLDSEVLDILESHI